MVDFDCKTKLVQSTTNLPNKSTKITSCRSMPSLSSPPSVPSGDAAPASESACSAYENYLRLPELRELWSSKEFPGWDNESIIKPALQALEITFRFVSIVLSDGRPYLNRREWGRRLESLARDQLELISVLCEEDETRGAAPIVDLSSSFGVVAHAGSSTEVWKLSGGAHATTMVCRTSESSLLPRLATWHKSADLSSRIFYSIESAMRRCVYTLGLGEPNLDGKPNLNYDAVCRPSELHALKKCALTHNQNPENSILFTIHQIFESWVFAAGQLLTRIGERISNKEFSKAADDCWVLEKMWKLLEEIENVHYLMDPDDFLHLKAQLRIKSSSDSDTFCFRSKGLMEIMKQSKDLRHRVPEILAVQVDPMGGPIIQEAAMGLYREKRSFEKIHLLQAFQGVESAVKGFFYNYKQLLVVMMGSLEAKANRAVVDSESSDLLAQIFLEPTYYPSLDGAKTFIGDFWEHDQTVRNQNKTRQ